MNIHYMESPVTSNRSFVTRSITKTQWNQQQVQKLIRFALCFRGAWYHVFSCSMNGVFSTVFQFSGFKMITYSFFNDSWNYKKKPSFLTFSGKHWIVLNRWYLGRFMIIFFLHWMRALNKTECFEHYSATFISDAACRIWAFILGRSLSKLSIVVTFW